MPSWINKDPAKLAGAVATVRAGKRTPEQFAKVFGASVDEVEKALKLSGALSDIRQQSMASGLVEPRTPSRFFEHPDYPHSEEPPAPPPDPHNEDAAALAEDMSAAVEQASRFVPPKPFSFTMVPGSYYQSASQAGPVAAELAQVPTQLTDLEAQSRVPTGDGAEATAERLGMLEQASEIGGRRVLVPRQAARIIHEGSGGRAPETGVAQTLGRHAIAALLGAADQQSLGLSTLALDDEAQAMGLDQSASDIMRRTGPVEVPKALSPLLGDEVGVTSLVGGIASDYLNPFGSIGYLSRKLAGAIASGTGRRLGESSARLLAGSLAPGVMGAAENVARRGMVDAAHADLSAPEDYAQDAWRGFTLGSAGGFGSSALGELAHARAMSLGAAGNTPSGSPTGPHSELVSLAKEVGGQLPVTPGRRPMLPREAPETGYMDLHEVDARAAAAGERMAESQEPVQAHALVRRAVREIERSTLRGRKVPEKVAESGATIQRNAEVLGLFADVKLGSDPDALTRIPKRLAEIEGEHGYTEPVVKVLRQKLQQNPETAKYFEATEQAATQATQAAVVDKQAEAAAKASRKAAETAQRQAEKFAMQHRKAASAYEEAQVREEALVRAMDEDLARRVASLAAQHEKAIAKETAQAALEVQRAEATGKVVPESRVKHDRRLSEATATRDRVVDELHEEKRQLLEKLSSTAVSDPKVQLAKAEQIRQKLLENPSVQRNMRQLVEHKIGEELKRSPPEKREELRRKAMVRAEYTMLGRPNEGVQGYTKGQVVRAADTRNQRRGDYWNGRKFGPRAKRSDILPVDSQAMELGRQFREALFGGDDGTIQRRLTEIDDEIVRADEAHQKLAAKHAVKIADIEAANAKMLAMRGAPADRARAAAAARMEALKSAHEAALASVAIPPNTAWKSYWEPLAKAKATKEESLKKVREATSGMGQALVVKARIRLAEIEAAKAAIDARIPAVVAEANAAALTPDQLEFSVVPGTRPASDIWKQASVGDRSAASKDLAGAAMDDLASKHPREVREVRMREPRSKFLSTPRSNVSAALGSGLVPSLWSIARAAAKPTWGSMARSQAMATPYGMAPPAWVKSAPWVPQLQLRPMIAPMVLDNQDRRR